MKAFILASNSPRRKELLQQIHIPFQVDPSGVEEQVPPGLSPKQTVLCLARQKAADVAKRHQGSCVIGADTLVVLNGQCLGKPMDCEDALRMMHLLTGKMHQVMTGVVVLDTATGKQVEAVEITDVTMGPLSEERMLQYVASGEPMGKAGAYAIQGTAAAFIEKIDGCYNNVVGLPLYRLCRLIDLLQPQRESDKGGANGSEQRK
ncbi:MAG TPA: nucleoside triphosphate pyrophosphatase [Bacillota bacterium]|nr:nucleoside triphosphate pyrophosphatase [Bacillota bacterium]